MNRILLLEDTRQQVKKHTAKHQWFLKNGISWTRETLNCGDYQLAGKSDVAVDTKKDIQELIGDIQAKTISKSAVSAAVKNLLTVSEEGKYHKDLVNIITSDDTNRDVDNEITMYIYENRLSETLISRLQTLYTKYRGFFHRGLVRAQIRRTRLFILVASDPEMIGMKKDILNKAVTDIESLKSWTNPRSLIVKAWTKRDTMGNRKPIYKYPYATKGDKLAKSLETMELKYGCKFVFCRNKDMGKRIIELLTGETYER